MFPLAAPKINPLEDPWWRLNNLYFIKDADGKKVKFSPNPQQTALHDNLKHRNCVLKNRQIGITTFFQIFMLDRCIFNSYKSAGVVAHTRDDAEKFFDHKIKFAYDNLPPEIKAWRKANTDTAKELKFNNDSSISVGTSLRSGTYQYLHISELGPMYEISPKKAQEVVSGSLNTIHNKGMLLIESTSRGPKGPYYEICKNAERATSQIRNGDRIMSPMDYWFHFFPWWQDAKCWLDIDQQIDKEHAKYFSQLETQTGEQLTNEQKWWYVAKHQEQGDAMKQENPGTIDEAFMVDTDVAIYGKQLRKAQEQKRITDIPIVRGVPVNTFWDLGRNDVNAIWLHQHNGEWHDFVYYFEDRLQDLTYYWQELIKLRDSLGIHYGSHYLPHDINQVSQDNPKQITKKKVLEEAGMRSIVVVPRIDHLTTGIELTRKQFDTCRFDAKRCEVGIRALQEYEWVYDKVYNTTRKTPKHNWASNGADAFRQHAQGYKSQAVNAETIRRLASSASNPFNPRTRRL